MQNRYKRSIYFAKLSVQLNAVVAIAKILLGIFSLSFFLCVNAFYNIGIAIAKHSAVKVHETSKVSPDNSNQEEIRNHQHSTYRFIGIIVMTSSLLYIVYCSKIVFFGGSNTQYHPYIGLAIATITFTEIIVSFVGVIAARRSYETVIEAIRLTNFASSLTSLVLTQAAILSFTYKGDASFYNGLSGIIFGSLAALIGLYMILRNPERKSFIAIISQYVIEKLKSVYLTRKE
ncbi:hypothetical protein [Paenibacillus donghaensis]|uniref:Uncharacterized protein n=1 Tax=Paenibacillus donghaensis TaxID=414771 RepID=A0A2Z2KHC2_9BACL|nr:hypothetical protein [Paenibacillus donghaensis]ASA23475.1 hypothetical protein B9T62_23320 [Paenibacillus donghaensis]